MGERLLKVLLITSFIILAIGIYSMDKFGFIVSFIPILMLSIIQYIALGSINPLYLFQDTLNTVIILLTIFIISINIKLNNGNIEMALGASIVPVILPLPLIKNKLSYISAVMLIFLISIYGAIQLKGIH